MKKIRVDFFIILCIILAAPIGFTVKSFYKNQAKEDTGKYSMRISVNETLTDLNHYNFQEHYKVVKSTIDKKEKMSNFAACIVFNRYSDDLILYNKNMYTDANLLPTNPEKMDLLNWCLASYKTEMTSDINPKYMSAYYQSAGLNFLYGFKGELNLEKASSYFRLSLNTYKQPEVQKIVSAIEKYQNTYPTFKQEFLLPYIDNYLKLNKTK
jgi:hypothetical protein